MSARPLSKAAADALGQLILEHAKDHKRRAAGHLPITEADYMRAAAEDIAATLLGAVCGSSMELELRRLLQDGRRPAASFGPSMRSEAEQRAASQRQAKALRRFQSLPRPSPRFIDHTHPQD